MTLIAIAASSFMLGLSGAMMPGPLLTITIAESIRRGISAGPLLISGHALLEGIVVVLLFLGMDDYLRIPLVFSSVALLGGGMLLWMGIGMLKSLPRLCLDLNVNAGMSLHPLPAGVVISIANPYFSLWWATVGLGYLVIAQENGIAGIVVFYLFHILSDFVWYSFISGAVTFGRRYFDDRIYRAFVAGCAVFIILFGVYFGVKGIEKFSTVS